jgi:16S rRNA (guanine966-N2)-methyltransferase
VTRIVAGTLGGRRLVVPPGRGTRPTSDRVREALFGAVDALLDLDGARVADLYAGSGAIGLEAVSRGAAHVLLVESDARAVSVLRRNVSELGVAATTRVAAAPVRRVLAEAPGEPYDLVFADPPYDLAEDELAAVLGALVDGGWLAEDAVLVLERSSRSPEPVWVPGTTGTRSRRYGETTLWYGRAS